mmetsp:Transcript_33484/g.107627  ORF Transcript_33484/g.107627 Transcript_33484/m.107627 type:complete len:327 (-) Transcript_33484:230-1210(-)
MGSRQPGRGRRGCAQRGRAPLQHCAVAAARRGAGRGAPVRAPERDGAARPAAPPHAARPPHQAGRRAARLQRARSRGAGRRDCRRRAGRRRARAARRVPVGAAHAGGRRPPRRRLLGRVGAQDVWSDGRRLPLGAGRGAGGDAALAGRRGDDRPSLGRRLHLFASPGPLRGWHARHHAGDWARRGVRLPPHTRHGGGGGVRARARRVPLRPPFRRPRRAHLRAAAVGRAARRARRLQRGGRAPFRPGRFRRPGRRRHPRGAPLHAAAAPGARHQRRIGARVALRLLDKGRRGRLHHFARGDSQDVRGPRRVSASDAGAAGARHRAL